MSGQNWPMTALKSDGHSKAVTAAKLRLGRGLRFEVCRSLDLMEKRPNLDEFRRIEADFDDFDEE